jgi:hypothetical protein
MSFPNDSGFYYTSDGLKKLYFNPCYFLNFDSTTEDSEFGTQIGIADAKNDIDHATFAVINDGASYYALTKDEAWTADTITAVFP